MWEDKIKMYLQGGDRDWIDLAHDRNGWHTLVNVVMKLTVP